MVPYADLINHSPFSQSYIDAREGGDWLFSGGEEEVILYADRGYRRMEQVNDVSVSFISITPSSIDTQHRSHSILVQNQDLHFLRTKVQC